MANASLFLFGYSINAINTLFPGGPNVIERLSQSTSIVILSHLLSHVFSNGVTRRVFVLTFNNTSSSPCCRLLQRIAPRSSLFIRG